MAENKREPDEERLEELGEKIDKTRRRADGTPGVEEGDAAHPFTDKDPAFHETGRLSDVDDQTIAPG
jgi:hypothetical protein